MPRPNVGSAVIRLKRLEEPSVKVKDERHMFKLIRAAFNQRRKTLANAVKNFEGLSYSREEVENALTSLGLDTRVRGEALGLQEFAALSDALS
jgi:16S rRNA (adenine1518-N6/adenine1519-N6)-dimethyltransferase